MRALSRTRGRLLLATALSLLSVSLLAAQDGQAASSAMSRLTGLPPQLTAPPQAVPPVGGATSSGLHQGYDGMRNMRALERRRRAESDRLRRGSRRPAPPPGPSSLQGAQPRRLQRGDARPRGAQSGTSESGGRSGATSRPNSTPVPGIALPYSTQNVISTFGACRSHGRQHRGLDLGGVGRDAGLGTPVRAMARSQITMIGLSRDNPAQFGRVDTRSGYAHRGGMRLPRSRNVSGYGLVYFFTANYGSWNSGNIVVTQALDAPLRGHQIRYMHLAAVHPGLRVGDVVEAGQEIGLMGGTAIMQDHPHVHIDIEDRSGRRVDVAPYLGLPADTRRCSWRWR